jgi:hypothetical protein
MSEPWFDPNAFGAWYGSIAGGVGGTLIGMLGGIAGGVLIPRGKGKAFVLGAMALFTVLGAMSLLVGVVALLVGQPYGIWFPLCLVGVIYAGVCGPLIPTIKRRYRQAEELRMEAASIRTS